MTLPDLYTTSTCKLEVVPIGLLQVGITDKKTWCFVPEDILIHRICQKDKTLFQGITAADNYCHYPISDCLYPAGMKNISLQGILEVDMYLLSGGGE